MSDYLDPENEELLADFFSEAQLQVEMLESNILVLEGDPKSKDAIDEIFRAAHTLKGGSATVQMTELAHFTHLVEDVFDLIRSDKLLVDDHIIDTLLRSVDVIKNMLEERMAGSVYTQDISELVDQLKAILNQKQVAQNSMSTSQNESVVDHQIDVEETSNRLEVKDSVQELGEYELLELEELSKGQEIYRICAFFDIDDPMASVGGVQVYSAIKNLGNVLRSCPAVEELMGDAIHKEVVYYATFNELHEREEIAFKLELGGVIERVKVELFRPSLNEESSQNSSHIRHENLNKEEWEELKEATSKDQEVYKITAYMDLSDPMVSVGGVQMFSLLKRLGTVLLTFPSFEALMGEEVFEQVCYYVHFNEYSDPESMLEKISPGGAVAKVELEKLDLSKEFVEQKPAEPKKLTSGTSKGPSRTIESTSTLSAPVPKKSSPTSGGGSANQIIRIDNRRIDHLLNLVSETVINKAALNQINLKLNEMWDIFSRIGERYNEMVEQVGESLIESIQEHGLENWNIIKSKLNEDLACLNNDFRNYEVQMKGNLLHFKLTAQSLGRTISELHESILRIRMVPVHHLFSKFTRVVRDLSKQLGKKVLLHFEGEETELDKSVIDELSDPIMHCVRNSMDHGIELPQERQQAGKSEEGNILLKASNEGNQIIIEIIDDGKGVNAKTIRQRAIEKGLISKNKNLSDHELINLIFEPGFSTAEKITDLSGRGVGLDVVKKNIEKLNGTVFISSEYGEGSRFVIRLPLTLAIVQTLLVKVKDEVYAIPINSVLESHRIAKNQVKVIDGFEMFDLHSRVISLIRLSDIFRISVVDDRDFYFVIVVGTPERAIGLVVDHLIGEEDLVIKPLKDRYTQTTGVAGAALLGDGQVALILDVAKLIDLGMQVGDSLRK